MILALLIRLFTPTPWRCELAGGELAGGELAGGESRQADRIVGFVPSDAEANRLTKVAARLGESGYDEGRCLSGRVWLRRRSLPEWVRVWLRRRSLPEWVRVWLRRRSLLEWGESGYDEGRCLSGESLATTKVAA